MKAHEIKVISIGNSRGVRLPATTLRRYHIGKAVLMECAADAIILRPVGPSVEKLSWINTACEMAKDNEDWSEWDAVAGDGLKSIPWDKKPLVAAEQSAGYRIPRDARPTSRPKGKP